MKYLTALLMILGILPWVFSGVSDELYNFAYDSSSMLMLPSVLFVLFLNIPRTQILNRGLAAALTIGFSVKLINYISFMLELDFSVLNYVITTGLALAMLAQVFSWKDVETDYIDDSSTYFVFKKPKSFFDFIMTLFKVPISSFSILKGDAWYKYSKSYSGLYASGAESIDLNLYTIIKVKDVDEDILKSLVGTKWSIRKSNCITVFQPVFSSMGISLGKFDFIPSIFSYKFFKDHDKSSQ